MQHKAEMDDFAQQEVIFHAALQLTPGDARSTYLELSCGRDLGLRRRVEALLEMENDNDALRTPASIPSRALLSSAPSQAPGDLRDLPHQRIGRYRLLEKIAEGGFGAVYRAEQERPVRRPVALKLIKPGMDTSAVIARFEAERQALALMDHPNIAKVFDAGASETGRPYFVMELVEGIKITDYCAENRLSIKDRLNLFLKVCDAVQHAHQKGIIHRDLKPSNILISDDQGRGRLSRACDSGSCTDSASTADENTPKRLGGSLPLTWPPSLSSSSPLNPVPKIIDFGIAKSLSVPLTDATIHTGLHQFLGTPAYMSPEQADLSPDIDTRTDIYSLGVLLYELLTGRPPFDNHELLTAGLDEMRRIIREKEPPVPSRFVGSNARGFTSSFYTRRLKSEIDRDLDCIVLKCLEKERSRRYEGASAFASDIQRYLNNEPIAAHPQSASYRIAKFLQRYRTVSVAVVLITFSVIAGSVIATIALVKERQARNIAEQRLKAAAAFVSELSDDVMGQMEAIPGNSKLNESLATAGLTFAGKLRASAEDNPEITLALSSILVRLGRAEFNQRGNQTGHPERALQRASEAIQLLNQVDPTYLPAERLWLLKEAYNRCAVALEGLGRIEEALQIRSNHVEPLMVQVMQFDQFAAQTRSERIMNRSAIAFDLIQLGREREAIEEYSRPLLQSEWARSITTNSPFYDIGVLAGTHAHLAIASERLEDWPGVIHNLVEAVRLHEILRAREPNDLNIHGFISVLNSLHGQTLVRLGRVNDGLELLNAQIEIQENLLKKDAAHAGFKQGACIVSMRRARALALVSLNSEDALETRKARVSKASEDLARVESIIASMERPPAYPQFVRDLELTRAEVALATAKLSDEKETSKIAPTHSPP